MSFLVVVPGSGASYTSERGMSDAPEGPGRLERRVKSPSPSQPIAIAGAGAASDYARRLLGDLGLPVSRIDGARDPHPALAWARSGAMALTGRADGLPRVPSGPLASCASGVARALSALGAKPPADAAALLGERAATAGLARCGDVSAGGRCRLLRTADGHGALNLARAGRRRNPPRPS
jgi:hypothetical protein